jgi:uncharacterized protein (TIGR02271 family)
MTLAKIADIYPNYQKDIFAGNDIKNFSVYSDNDRKIGSVYDILIDLTGRFRYLVINTSFSGVEKKVLLPIGLAKVDYHHGRFNVAGFKKEQAEQLPEYNDQIDIDDNYEKKVKNIYRMAAASTNNSHSYQYDYEPLLYQVTEPHHRQFWHYQNLLLGHQDRFHLDRPVGKTNLYKIVALYSNFQEEILGNDDFKNYPVCNSKEEEIGTLEDVLVDRDGYFRYFVISSSGKTIWLPVGCVTVDLDRNRIHVDRLSQDLVTSLPEYSDNLAVDYNYEEKIRNIFRRDKANVNDDSNEGMNDREHQTLKLYEERLIAHKDRVSTGSVSVGKRVETETVKISVPVAKERVVIERKQPTNTEPVAPGTISFTEGEIIRMEIYEESANVEKQTFVREEVEIRKEIDRDIVDLEDTVRREELKVDSDSDKVSHTMNESLTKLRN